MDNNNSDNFFLWLMALAVFILLVLSLVIAPNRHANYDIHPAVYETLYNRMLRTCELINHEDDSDCADIVREAMQTKLENIRYCNGFTIGYDNLFADCLNARGIMP